MNDFRASNGVRVVPTNSGMTAYSPGGSWPSPEAGDVFLNADVFAALREFFRAEEDGRLGRWRWPENPDITVRPINDGLVGVVKEDAEGRAYGQFRRGEHASGDGMSRAARSYFEAHPEPKPWHYAKPGQTWVLTVSGVGMSLTVDSHGEFQGLITLSPHSTSITAGRRIWPEVTS